MELAVGGGLTAEVGKLLTIDKPGQYSDLG